MNNSLSVIIPAYNEEDGIVDIVKRVLAIEPGLIKIGLDGLELIVVDDGSTDRTVEIVKSIPGVRLITHKTNKGYGAALKTGFNAGTGRFLGFLDADGTYPPDYFPVLCEAGLNGTQLVVGSRRSGTDSEMPLVRRIGNYLWSSLVTMICGIRVHDRLHRCPSGPPKVIPGQRSWPAPSGAGPEHRSRIQHIPGCNGTGAFEDPL